MTVTIWRSQSLRKSGQFLSEGTWDEQAIDEWSQSLRKSGQFLSGASRSLRGVSAPCRNPFVNQVSFFYSTDPAFRKQVEEVAIPS